MLWFLVSAGAFGILLAGVSLLLVGKSLALPHAPGKMNSRLAPPDLELWLNQRD